MVGRMPGRCLVSGVGVLGAGGPVAAGGARPALAGGGLSGSGGGGQARQIGVKRSGSNLL